ncbi:ABC transporter permease [Massilia sp. Root418]|uniref:ABC transporter permease n=1 Tax=Massilia sp. Root418 TaxID=1736532 RepID=UPI0006FAD3EA|nr:ABC transporter permease [Massilia sp. Root418]KQW94016.1 ABC transporter permease [Massilia sp. Root418]
MLRNYLLTAFKVFMRRKLFTAINLACIVLTLVVLLVVTALLQNAFQPTGVEGRSGRYLQVHLIEARGADRHQLSRSPLGFKMIEQALKPIKSAQLVSAVTGPETVSVYQGDRVSELLLRRTDAEYWGILDFTVLAGRVLNADDVAQGRMVAVVNATTARKLFAGASALGQPISTGGQLFKVVGVVEDELHLNAFSDIWVPHTTYASSEYRNQQFGNFTALLMARDQASLPLIKEEVMRAARNFQFDDPKAWATAQFWADNKLELFSRMLTRSEGEDSGAATVLAALAVLMLLFMLLPALNLVNLNMGRIMERSGEIGVRKAFGATSAQLAGQLLLENVLLCLAGGALSLLCTWGLLAWLEASALIPYLKVHLNFTVFGYGLMVTIVFGLLSGVLPAWKMSRLDPVHALKGAA